METEQLNAIQATVRCVQAVFNPPGTPAEDLWQVEVGEGVSLEEALCQVNVRLPVAFIIEGSFMADPEAVINGQCRRYERKITVYMIKLGTFSDEVELFLDYMNEPRTGTLANNQFIDRKGLTRTLFVEQGDGASLQQEGAPAYAIQITVQ